MTTVKRILDRANTFLDSLKVLNDQTPHLYPLPPKLFILGHAFELTLKAYLTANEVKFKKNHDLIQLFDLCSNVDVENSDIFVSKLGVLAQALAPHYSIEVRYPTVDVKKQSVGELEAYEVLPDSMRSEFTPDPEEAYQVVRSLYDKITALYEEENNAA